jgi:hypothetical protein
MVGAGQKLRQQLKVLPFPCQYTFSLMSFIVNNGEIFQILIYTELIQRTNTIYTDQMPTFHVFRKVHSMLASELSTVYRVVSQVLGMKRRFLMCKDYS